MLWMLVIVIWTAESTAERFEATPVDWATCRRGEMKQAAGWHGHYAGGEIIAARCTRVNIVETTCEGVCG
jgi:hypothetical protein